MLSSTTPSRRTLPAAAILLAIAACGIATLAAQVPEDVYRGELLTFPGAWAFQIPSSAIILTRDDELVTLATDPDKILNLTLGRDPQMESLRQICERAQARGERTIKVAFDQFFKQYRPGQDTPRRLMPDMDEYISRIAQIGRFAEKYGLGLELSLLTPLEAGPAYARTTGESGTWLQYRKGLRDPKSGAFSVQLWRHTRWTNNKGPVNIAATGVRAFAFSQKRASGTPYWAVDPASIVEIAPENIHVEVFENLVTPTHDFLAQRVRIYGSGPAASADGLDHVLVVQQYRTPEMDYFSPKALPFLKALIDKYAAAGVKLNGLYSDEMHIQGDWVYFSHHDNGQLTLRYVTPALARRFADLYGDEYRDFAKYLLYFTYAQDDTANDLTARQYMMHSFGPTPEDIRRTALFRARYYHLLQNGVVDLFTEAKHYAEQKMGKRLEARAHATWAQSPTIDYWDTAGRNPHPSMYEYTSNFLWSNTVHQAATACYDYFKWGDFLTGNGNDHAEGGWLDRNYLGLALAASTGILNEVPNSYGAHWGMPAEVNQRRTAVMGAYGDSAPPLFAAVEGMEHRDVDVLMLYPIDLVAVEERFGSWMAQYGYANLVTADKLIERGKVVDGGLEMAGRRFTTLVATFEPFASPRLIEFMSEFARRGGRLIWSGPPPVIGADGSRVLDRWQDLFGLDYRPERTEGLGAPGMTVSFSGPLGLVRPQVILTDMLPDHVYPVTPRAGTRGLAQVKRWTVGTGRVLDGGGLAVFLGFRPRDDQSASLGYDVRTWFDILDALGSYPGDGNTERLSRTSELVCTRFPNGATAIAPHLKLMEENWPGGFARDPEADRKALAENPVPSDALHLAGLQVNRHTVVYDGTGAMAFRTDTRGNLVAFAGAHAREVTVDGRRTVFANAPLDEIGWAPVAAARYINGGALMQILVRGAAGRVTVPIVNAPANAVLVAEGPKPGSRGAAVPARFENGGVTFEVTPAIAGRWLYVVPASNR
jgi:hypothetical protein